MIVSAIVAVGACDRKDDAQKQAAKIEKKNKTVMQSVPIKSVAGNYLAARFAVGQDDLRAADLYYKRTLDEMAEQKVPVEDQAFLTERALPAAIGAGNMTMALDLARSVDLDKNVATSQLAVTLLLVDAFNENDYKIVEELLAKLKPDGFGRLLKPLMEVWYNAGIKQNDKAIAQLMQFAKDYPSLRSLTDLHTAFLYDLEDDKANAERYYARTLDQNLSVRSAWIVGQYYERQGQTDKALKLYSELSGKVQGSPFAQLVIERMKNGDANKDRMIKNPRDGVAAALYDVATVLHQENSSRLAILYGQMAYQLTPHDPFVNLLLGDVIATADVPDQAKEFYESVPKSSDLYILAQFRLAQYYEQKKDNDKATAILNELADDPALARQAYTEIADLYRRQEDYAKAIPYYDKAIDLIKVPVAADWALYYARGICYEREKQWDKAERDLQNALELDPKQPEVLNYLAYSWADNGKNLDKALQMLQSALAAAPNDPYITDSVGWALYKAGRYEDAVPYLEAAVQELPADATINDHLGDIYWRVGRKLEAQYQWQRALKQTGPHDGELKKNIQAKLDNGMADAAQVVTQSE